MKSDTKKHTNLLGGSGINSNPSDTHQQLKLITEIGKQLSLVNNPEDLCLMVVNLLQSSLDYESVAIWLLDPSGETLILETIASRTDNVVASRQLDCKQTNHYVVRAWQAGEACLGFEDSKIYKLAIPILNLNDPFAILEIQQSPEGGIHANELILLDILVNQISASLRNAYLFMEFKRAKEEAELATRLKSQFLTSLSGTLRAPLTAILNWTEFILRGSMGRLNKEQSDIMKMLISNTELVLQYINDGLDISQINVGKALLFVEDIAIEDILADSVKLLSASVAKKPIRIETEIAPDMPHIRGDQRRLEQIFLSLVSTSLKLTHEGTISIKAFHEDGKIHIHISDTGEGIPPEAFEQVFRQSQNPNGMNSGNSGFGLGLTKYFVEAHRGKIWFESEVNKGTCFYLELLGVDG